MIVEVEGRDGPEIGLEGVTAAAGCSQAILRRRRRCAKAAILQIADDSVFVVVHQRGHIGIAVELKKKLIKSLVIIIININ